MVKIKTIGNVMPFSARIPQRFSLRLCLSLLLVALVLLTAGSVASIVYWRSANTVQRASDELLDRSAWGLNRHIDGLLAPADMALNLLVQSRLARANDEASRLDGLPLLRAVLEQGRALDAVYIAYPNGDFFLLRRLPRRGPASMHRPRQSICCRVAFMGQADRPAPTTVFITRRLRSWARPKRRALPPMTPCNAPGTRRRGQAPGASSRRPTVSIPVARPV